VPHSITSPREGWGTHGPALRPIAYFVMLACSELSLANPAGSQVVAGSATFVPSSKALVVTNTPGTIINWNTFSIARGEVTRFKQESAASAVLNRVVGTDASSILGRLSSNGRVFLINPNGILFGAGSVINTAGFVASTLNMSDQDFLAGKLRFEGGGRGVLRNAGRIRAHGDIVLVGPAIENTGVIRSTDGNVLLAAGKALTITSPDAHGITFTVQAPSDSAISLASIDAGNAGSMFTGTLRHSGDIVAGSAHRDTAGRIVIVAQKDVSVESGATLRANGPRGGDVRIQSGDTTLVSGRIEAVGSAGSGGNIQLLGNKVGVIDSASVNASGSTGGGTILIGGDYRGQNREVQNAFATFIGPSALVKADATSGGDGGRVIVWSDEAARVHGAISARGAAGGKGGFVETSGHYLDVTRAPDIGAGGAWLLDPRNIQVVSTVTTNNTGAPTFTPTGDDSTVLNSQINAQLDSGVSVLLDTNAGGGTQAGNILVSAAIDKTANNAAFLTFNAQNDVTINAPITLASGAFNVTTLNAGSTMTVNNVVNAGARAGTGTMNLNLAGGLVVQSTSATQAVLRASNDQTIVARSLVLSASSTGLALIGNGQEAQSITINNAGAGSGVDVISTGSGGASLAHGFITGGGSPVPGPQTITVNNGDRLRVAGLNGSAIIQSSLDQTITLQGTGANEVALGAANAIGSSRVDAFGTQSVTAGNAGQAGAITLIGGVTDGFGSTIRKLDPTGAQTVVTSGTLRATGGSAASGTSGADAGVRHEGNGIQRVTAEEIVLAGGSGAGSDNNGFITTAVSSGGTTAALGEQRVTAGATGIRLTGGTGGQANLAHIAQRSTSAAQLITLNNGGSLTLTGGSSSGRGNDARILTDGPAQTINFSAGGNIELTGGTNGTLNSARITTTAAGMQTIAGATGITLTGGLSGGGLDGSGNGLGNRAQIKSDVGSQNISVGEGGITLVGGAGPMTNNSVEIDQAGNLSALAPGTSQTITVNSGGTIAIQGGSTAQTNVVNGPNIMRGSFAQIQSTGDTQTIAFPNGGAINLTGGTVGSNNIAQIQLRFAGNQGITGAPAITITGGASGGTQNGAQNEGNRARIVANGGNQNITAGAITLTGGAGGVNNAAQIVTLAAGTAQTITAPGISLTGGAGGGGFVSSPSYSTRGNIAQIGAGGGQDITVRVGGITMAGGGGALTDNFASIFQGDTGAGRRQMITINNGGSVHITGGSSAGAAAAGQNSGSFAAIRADGPAGQTIDFANGGDINLTGGTNGTGNAAGIYARNGQQTISGSPTVAMIGGASGGIVDDGNNVTIEANVGPQTLTLGATQMTGGAGTAGTFATIRAPNQNITINGGLTLTGGTSGGVSTNARMGSFTDTPTNLTLAVGGDLTLLGRAGGASLGISGRSTVLQSADITVTATGNVVLNGGTTGVARIGQPPALLGGGNISVNAGGNIVLGSTATTGGTIHTAGNVTLQTGSGGSITETGATSVIQANTLTASAAAGIALIGNNLVTNLSATNSTAGGIQFTEAPGSLLTVTGISQSGGNVVLTADDLNITNPINAGAATVTLRPTTLSRNVNIETSRTAGTLSLSPSELDQITAATLEVGRLDSTGTLTVASPITDANLNSSRFRLLANDININADIGTSPTPLAKNLELRSANDAAITIGRIFIADNNSLTVAADNDNSGSGNVIIGGTQMIVGTSARNTSGNMLLQGNSVFASLGGSVGNANIEVAGSGAQTISAREIISFGNKSTGSGSLSVRTTAGTQTIDTCREVAGVCTNTGTGTLSLQGGPNAANVSVSSLSGSQVINLKGGLQVTSDTASNSSGTVLINADNGQTISAQYIELISRGAGQAAINNNTGSQNASNQTITTRGQNASSQGLLIEALGTTPGAGIFNLSTGTQTIGVNNAGRAVVRGTTAPAAISSSGAQSMALLGTGLNSLELGSATASSTSAIQKLGATGNQSITASGITVLGGSAANASARIQNSGPTQTVTINDGGAISLTGGSATNASAVIDNTGRRQIIDFSGGGTINVQGGSGTSATALIDNSGNSATLQAITFTGGGAINITGGTVGTRNFAQILAVTGDQTINGNPNITLTGSATGGGPTNSRNDAVIGIDAAATQTINAGNISIIGGAVGFQNNAGIVTDVSGSTSNITATGSVTLQGGAGTNSFVGIGSDRGNINLTLNAVGPITITGGSGAVGSAGFGSQAVIGTIGNFNANATVNSERAITLTKGAAPGAEARIGSATGGGTLNVNAGLASDDGLTLIGGIIGTSGNVRVASANDITVLNGLITAGGTLGVAAIGNLDVTATTANSVIRAVGSGAETISANRIRVRSLAASGSSIGAFINAVGDQTITAGSGGITLAAGGGTTNNLAAIQQTGAAGTQHITVNGGGDIQLTGGSGSGNSNAAVIDAVGTAQNVTFGAGGTLALTGGTVGTLNTAELTARNATARAQTQTISGATAISLTGGASGGGTDVDNNTLGNFAIISNSVGSQSITVGAGGISVTGGSGPLSDNFAHIIQGSSTVGTPGTTQTITINNGGGVTLQGGSSAQMNVVTGGSGNPNNFFRGSYASIQGNGDTEQITLNGGGALNITGGTVGSNNVAQMFARFGNQHITAASINMTGGASGGAQNGTVNEGNFARILSNVGNQTINATAGLRLTGGADGTNNSARIDSSGTLATQTIAASGITMTGGSGGAATNVNATGNSVRIRSVGEQRINVAGGGLNVVGGSGAARGNHANLQAAGTGSHSQIITVTNGGEIRVTGGASTGTNVGVDANGNGNGSFANITADGDTQTINFTEGGALRIAGGTLGSRNSASVRMPTTTGTQTITGAPSITLTGGASGGATDEGNSANISVDAGSQTITARAVSLTGGATGIENSATIRAPQQTIGATTVTLNGGGASPLAGARIGGGGTEPSATNLALTTSGDVTLAGGNGGPATIGGSSRVNTALNVDVAINSGGNITLTGGASSEARIGSPASLVQAGNISLTAAGSIAMNDGTGTGGRVRSAGNVTLHADTSGRSISQQAASFIRANTLTATAHSGIALIGNNLVTNFNATNTAANGIQFSQAAGSLLTLTGMPQTGGNVVVSADDMNITGAISAGAAAVTLQPTTLSRNVNIEAASTADTLSLTPGELQRITASSLQIGRNDGTGTLSVNTAIADSNLNVSALRLLDNDVNVNAALGTAATRLTKNVELRADNNTSVLAGGIFLADNRSLSLIGDDDGIRGGNAAVGGGPSAVAVSVGAGAENTGSMLLQGDNVSVTAAGGGTTVSVTGSGSQSFIAAKELFFGTAASAAATNVTAATGTQAFSAITGDMRLLASAGGVLLNTNGMQTVNVGGSLMLAGGHASNAFARLNSGGNQMINARGIDLAGGGGRNASNASAQISSNANQIVTVASDGIHVVGGTGSGTASNNFAGLFQQNAGNAFAQTITVNNGGSIVLQGGSSPQVSSFGGSSASMRASGGRQSVSFTSGGTIVVSGGTIGIDNFAQIYNANTAALQTVSGVTGITLLGGMSGGAEGPTPVDSFGNSAQLRGNGSQEITVGIGGITAIGGSGNADNSAQVRQGPAVNVNFAGPGTHQTINVNNGGNITLQGGSTSAIATAAGTGSYGRIRGEGDAQTINFANGGSISITGGVVGSRNKSEILSNSGVQTITGSPNVTMTGGASGGADGDGNFARIHSDIAQNLTLGNVQLIGGGGFDSFAAIQSPNQNLTVNGSLTLTGSSGGAGSAGSRIGGTSNAPMDLALTVHGAITLNGGAVSSGGSALGPSSNSGTPQNATLNISADGDVTLNGGSSNGTRIGQPAGLVGGGDIVVTAGGNIALNRNGTTAGSIRTTGNVTLHADKPGKSIRQAANSTIAANILTASANGVIDLAGTNQVTKLILSSTNGGVAFSSNRPVTIDPNSFNTAPGTQSVTVTTTGATSDITVSGNSTSDDDIVLVSARDIIVAGGSTLGAHSAAVSGGGALRFPSGVITLNMPLTALMPVNISGATVNFNGGVTASQGLALSGGRLQGSGSATITGGTFVWSGGGVSGSGPFTTQAATSIAGPSANLDDRTWNNTGTVAVTGPGRLILSRNAVVNNQPGGIWNVSSTDPTPVVGLTIATASSTGVPGPSFPFTGNFSNAGSFNNDGATAHTINVPFTNTGTLNVNAGTLTLQSFPTNAGTLFVANDATFATGGAALNNTGTIGGNGTIDLAGAMLTNNGNVSPGASPGDLTIFGDYTQSSAGVLTIEVAGTNPGTEYDVLNVNGNATLGGTLNIVPVNGYTPPPQQNYNVVTYNSHSGDFNSVNSGYTPAPGQSSYSVAAAQSSAPPPGNTEMVVAATSSQVLTLNEQTTTTQTLSQEAAQEQQEGKTAAKAEKREVTRECR
jgi:filamentous hemagglutinin family protein